MKSSDFLHNKVLLVFFTGLLSQNITFAQSLHNICQGEKKDLVIASQMPYTKAKVGNTEGYFMVDFGTTGSTIDPTAFIGGKPKPISGSTNKFASFDFFGSWGKVNLNVQDHSNIHGLGDIRQAGIIGTDFLSVNVYTIDYANKAIYKAKKNSFCKDSVLLSSGYKPVSTIGYYSNDFNQLKPNTPNIPTIPIKIGKVEAVAQIDSGYDDGAYRHSVNINESFYNSIKKHLIEVKEADSSLSTCTGISEKVKAFKLKRGKTFEIIGTDGEPVLVSEDAYIFLKKTPPEAKVCGGIGTWKIPAAQIGASFLNDAKSIIFDPFASKVWFYDRN